MIFLITPITVVTANISSRKVRYHFRIFILSLTCYDLVYYTTALPGLMLFVLTDRFWTAVAQVVELILLLVFVIPVQGIYARNVVSFVSINGTIVIVH